MDAVAGTPVRAARRDARPPLVDSAARPRPRGPPRRRERRRHRGGHRPRPVHRQPEHREDGRAIAEAALARGARVTIVAGRVEVPLPAAAAVVHAESTAAMRDAVLDAVIDNPADVLVMAAAVADFRPASAAATKLTRGEGMTLELEPTEDILAEVGARARELRPAAGHRRVRGGDGLARPGARQAPPEGRGPARRERRQRARLGVRHRHQPGRDPRCRRVARRAATALEARGRGPPAGPGRRAVGRTARVARTLARHHGRPHERPDRDRPPPVGPRHREALRRRHAHRHDHRLRLPDGRARGRGGHPADPRRRHRWRR